MANSGRAFAKVCRTLTSTVLKARQRRLERAFEWLVEPLGRRRATRRDRARARPYGRRLRQARAQAGSASPSSVRRERSLLKDDFSPSRPGPGARERCWRVALAPALPGSAYADTHARIPIGGLLGLGSSSTVCAGSHDDLVACAAGAKNGEDPALSSVRLVAVSAGGAAPALLLDQLVGDQAARSSSVLLFALRGDQHRLGEMRSRRARLGRQGGGALSEALRGAEASLARLSSPAYRRRRHSIEAISSPGRRPPPPGCEAFRDEKRRQRLVHATLSEPLGPSMNSRWRLRWHRTR